MTLHTQLAFTVSFTYFILHILTFTITLASYLLFYLTPLLQMIDSMAEAIKQFNGGVVVISHDFRSVEAQVQ